MCFLANEQMNTPIPPPVTDEIDLKRCSGCKQELPANNEYFSNNVAMADGLALHCKTCVSDWNKKKKDKTIYKMDQEKTRTCHQCGHTGPEADFYRTGMHGVTSTCKKCVQSKRRQKWRERTDNAAKLWSEACVVIDFASFEELYKEIRDAAKQNFRTLENEILYRLVNYAN
jgi:hypothetical protein